MNLADKRFQITEIYQVTSSRQAYDETVCQMLSAKFLLEASCFLKIEATERSAA
jgi:hypothetical protein